MAGEKRSQPGESILSAVHVAFEKGAPSRPGEDRPPQPPPTEPVPDQPPSPSWRSQLAPGRPRSEDPGSALFSADPGERRQALASLLENELGPAEVEAISQVLQTDPDPEVRLAAAQVLARVPSRIPRGVIENGLRDPNDRVRAATVRVAAKLGGSALPSIIPLATERDWPSSQQTALSALPDLIRSDGPGEGHLDTLLAGVAALDPPPLRFERPGLEAIARAVGVERLVRELHGPHPRRLGAARLLLLEGSPSALRPVAALADDPIDGVRLVAAGAAHLLGTYRIQAEGENRSPDAPPSRAVEPAETSETELIGPLARALSDPDQSVRAQALSALGRVDRDLLEAWAEQALSDGSAVDATHAASLVEHLGLTGTARLVLQRGSAVLPDSRGPYLRALASLRLSPAELVRLPEAVDPAHRQSAVRLLWQLGGRRLLPHLTPLLDDTAGPVRMAVLELLAESGDPGAVDVARNLLAGDSSAAVRATAVHVLARAEDPTRQEALTMALADPDPDVRATAVERLPRGSSSDVVQLLLHALQDEDERVWRASIDHLATLPDRDLPLLWSALRQSSKAKREELIATLERDDPDRLASLAVGNARSPRSTERALATELAARAATPECTTIVLSALADPDPRVRRTAATAMSTLRTASAVEALSRTLSDPRADVRVEAVRALGLIDDDGVPDLLISALKDPELRVRELASEALATWHSPAVARRLAGALASPDLRKPAGEVLERMGQAAVEPLVEVAIGTDPRAATAAGAVLDRIGGAEFFLSGLSSIDPDERLRAVRVLGAIGGPAASEALLLTLSDPDVRVRVRSAALLGELGAPAAEKALRHVWLTDPVGEVADAAEEALRALGAVPTSDDLRIVEEVPEDLPGPARD
ncbi:MAG: HEAT repeat domain-containing protein [Actinomycetota bacterium]